MQVSTRNTSTLPIVGARNRQRPPQATFIRPAQMSLFARVTCYPPLGQVTCPQRVQKALRSEDDDVVSLPCSDPTSFSNVYIMTRDSNEYCSCGLPSSSSQALHSQHSPGKPRSGTTSPTPNGQLFHSEDAIHRMCH